MRFIQGENKEVGIKIVSRTNVPFIIRNATFELKTWDTHIVEAQGIAIVDEKTISAIVSPINKGTYTLTFTYEIALEILKADVQIEVR